MPTEVGTLVFKEEYYKIVRRILNCLQMAWLAVEKVSNHDAILLSKNRILLKKKLESNCLVKVKSLSRVRLFVTPWTVAHQARLSMGFSRQECWSGLPFPSPGDLPDPGIEPRSPALQAHTLTSEPPGKHRKKRSNIPY